MRSGSGQAPRRPFYGNRPPQPQQQRPPQRGHVLDSNGPGVKIRGSAHQIFERYLALAREAMTADDRIAAENLYQHAEHYFRLANASRDGSQQGTPRPTTPADTVMVDAEPGSGDIDVDHTQPGWGDDRPGFL
jgi:hypothetical protein